MISYEDLELLINSIKSSLDETAGALVSEDLLSIVSNYKLAIDKIAELEEQVAGLQADKDELLKVNGRLFQKVGFDKVETEEPTPEENKEEEITIEEIVDEKGDLI